MHHATALITHEDQRFALERGALPATTEDRIRVRVHYSGVSVGTEFALIRNRISWGPYPLCTGYQATGVVEEVGPSARGFAVGDAVYLRACDAMTLDDGARVSPVSGTHASRVVLRTDTTHGAAQLVEGVDMATASHFVLPAVGLNGVDTAQPRMGDCVVVHGCGPIGLGVLAACVHRGCRVVAVDVEPQRLAVARAFGAQHLVDAREQDVAQVVRELAPDGADCVFECTGRRDCIDLSIALCRRHGSLVLQGHYGSGAVQFDFLPAHGRRLRMHFPCDDGGASCREAVLRNMALGALPWQRAISHTVGWREAPELYARILAGAPEVLGAVIDWRDADADPESTAGREAEA